MELEEPTTEFRPVIDNRARMPEPLPVRLIAIEDVRLPAPANLEEKLDAFYITLLQFERAATDPDKPEIAYRADNFTLRLQIQPDRPVPHESLRPQGIEIPSLIETEKKLLELQHEYTRQRGLTPGLETLLLLDPAGNWIELFERTIVQ